MVESLDQQHMININSTETASSSNQNFLAWLLRGKLIFDAHKKPLYKILWQKLWPLVRISLS